MKDLISELRKYKDVIDHCSFTQHISNILKAEKISGLNGIPARGICDTAIPEHGDEYFSNSVIRKITTVKEVSIPGLKAGVYMNRSEILSII